jgi:hypothetical protein
LIILLSGSRGKWSIHLNMIAPAKLKRRQQSHRVTVPSRHDITQTLNSSCTWGSISFHMAGMPLP